MTNSVSEKFTLLLGKIRNKLMLAINLYDITFIYIYIHIYDILVNIHIQKIR